MNKVVHFEIPVDDLARAKKFYSSIFSWEIVDWPMPGGIIYTGVRTVPVDEKTFIPKEPGAINGGMTKRSKEVPAPIITVSVSSIDEYVKKVEAAGGKAVMPKGEVPDMGFYAYVVDTEGNVIGLWEDLKEA
ncbi:MAG TPA: VOC family protein [Thermodesulfobacteriota bacterium]|nr:VOC family protein [Thermodesulfobacteriota bacterium]